MYFTVLFRLGDGAQETLDRWNRIKAAASRTIQAFGGTISHQHGVGLDHRPYLEAEKQPLGMELLSGMAAALDPKYIMNPGKLFGDRHGR